LKAFSLSLPYCCDQLPEIFTQLRRDRKLRTCLETLTSDTSGFVILMGESGCGKTSFLQAGVWPRLSMPTASHQAIYVRLSERPPLEAIQQAIATQLELPLDWLQPATPTTTSLYEMLAQAVEAAGKPIVLLLDQFEQFFVQFPREQDRADFIQALAAWYHPPRPVAAQVLVSIRADLSWRLYEIQQALGYTLGTDSCIQLDKFSPQDAAQVLVVIAETENLACDRRFITELAEQELANPKDGLISPVDVQILAWMIERQTAEELRAFNRQAFQKFGGVEGLLTRFLQRTLDTLPLPSQRQVAVKVLLALTDQEQQVRAWVQTVAELQDRLKSDAQPPEVREALKWLASSGVRLITPVERQGENGYELAHERLIPALMRQAGRELTAVDKANQLLDRRVNEWLGNQRHPRYLLRWHELNLIQRHKTHLLWGAREPQKRQLLQLSQRRRTRRISAISLIALMVSLFFGWLFYIPQGQIQLMRWGMDVMVANVPGEFVPPVALAIGKDGNWPKAFRLERRLVRQESITADFLTTAIAVVPRLQGEQQLMVVAQVVNTVEGITDPQIRLDVLRAIVQVISELDDATAAVGLLQQAIMVAEDISEAWPKSYALRAIAQAYGELDGVTTAAGLLQQTITVAEDISEPGPKSYALHAVAQAYGQLDDATAAAVVLQQAITAVRRIPEPRLKSNALRVIAQVYGELGNVTEATDLLKQAITAAEDISESEPKSGTLSAIARVYSELGNVTEAADLLKQAITTAEGISEPGSKFDALSAIAQVYSELGDVTATTDLLKQAITTAEGISEPGSKSDALSTITQTIGQLDDPTAATGLLKQAITVAEGISDEGISQSRPKSNALSAIAQAIGQLDDATTAANLLQQAAMAAEGISESGPKFSTLSAIAQAYGELGDGTAATSLLQQAITVAEDISEPGSKSNALSAIAQAIGQLDDPTAAASLLQQATGTVS
jgi:tetratricopeptide (TPR) repeat protein